MSLLASLAAITRHYKLATMLRACSLAVIPVKLFSEKISCDADTIVFPLLTPARKLTCFNTWFERQTNGKFTYINIHSSSVM